jgi:ribose-phosphate pyrophosphokinase
MGLENITVVSPDVGGIKSARSFAKRLNAELAVVDKRRVNSKQAEVMNIMGDVEGKNIVLVDDIISTAGSVTEAAQALKNKGAKDIYCCITHPILVGLAMERIKNSPIKTLFVSDSIPIGDKTGEKRIKVLSVAKLFGEAIKRIHKNESVSSLFI